MTWSSRAFDDHLEISDRAAWRAHLTETEGSAENVAGTPCHRAQLITCAPVLADEVRQLLAAAASARRSWTAPSASALGTALLAADLAGQGRVIAIDRDPTVEPYFETFRRTAGVQARLLRGDFTTVLEQLAANGREADAILLDLGVSSMQLDRPERGFSYAADAPLDMRMDPSQELSARELVNEASERELTVIFRRYGEERYARPIARAIVRLPPQRAVRAHVRSRGDDQGGDPGSGQVRLGPSGEARLPGAGDRGQRRGRACSR